MELICYNNTYGKNGAFYAKAAQTYHDESQFEQKRLVKVDTKKELIDLLNGLDNEGLLITHFVYFGEASMYGPMLGTFSKPDQLSVHEWQQLSINWEVDSAAIFFCSRGTRWFAPFFARTFLVNTYGFDFYVQFSKEKNSFVKASTQDRKVYAQGTLNVRNEASEKQWEKANKIAQGMYLCPPKEKDGDSSYDKVSHLYDAVFQDIKVRRDEWNWLNKHLPKKKFSMAEIGCGNGAMLNELSARIDKGYGLDASKGILEHAKKMNAKNPHISFHQIDGPILPLEDNSVDIFLSMLSFRYLDWDPLMEEIKRVLKPGGKFLVIDMVTAEVTFADYPKLLTSKMKFYLQKRQNATYRKALNELVSHPDWKMMLKYNPIRSEEEMKGFLESRFPNKKVQKLNVGWNSSVLAFDTGVIK